MQTLKATRPGAATGQNTGRSYKYKKGETITCDDGDLAHCEGDFEEIRSTDGAADPEQTVAADGDTHTVPDDADPEKQTDPTTPGVGNEPGTKATPEPDAAPAPDPDTGDEVPTDGADPADPNDMVPSGPNNEAVRANADDDDDDDPEKSEPEVGPTQKPEREPAEPTTDPGQHDTRPFEPSNLAAGPFAVGDAKAGGYYYVNDDDGNRVEDADGEPIVAGQGKDKAEAQVEAVNATLSE